MYFFVQGLNLFFFISEYTQYM